MHTDYALRTLLYLAHRQQQVPVEEIAAVYQISRDHLVKIVQELGRMGYVQSRSGRNGGVKLARDAESINIGEVVGRLEGRNGVVPCVADPNYCRLEPGCSLKGVLVGAEEAFYQSLSRATIGDLVRTNRTNGSGGLLNLTVNGTQLVVGDGVQNSL